MSDNDTKIQRFVADDGVTFTARLHADDHVTLELDDPDDEVSQVIKLLGADTQPLADALSELAKSRR